MDYFLSRSTNMQAEDISKAGLPVFDLISIGSQTNLKVISSSTIRGVKRTDRSIIILEKAGLPPKYYL